MKADVLRGWGGGHAPIIPREGGGLLGLAGDGGNCTARGLRRPPNAYISWGGGLGEELCLV